MMQTTVVPFFVGGLLTVLVTTLANNNLPYVAGVLGSAPLWDLGTLLLISTAALTTKTAYSNAISHIGVVLAMLFVSLTGGTVYSVIGGFFVWAFVASTVFFFNSS